MRAAFQRGRGESGGGPIIIRPRPDIGKENHNRGGGIRMALVRMNFESYYLGNNQEVGITCLSRKKGSPADFYGGGKKYRVLGCAWHRRGLFRLDTEIQCGAIRFPTGSHRRDAQRAEFRIFQLARLYDRIPDV